MLQHTHEWDVELSIHHQHIVALIDSGFNVGVLRLFVGGIEVNEIAIFVGLLCFNELFIVIEFEELSFSVAHEGKLHGLFAEFFIAEHAIFNKHLNIVPFLFKFLSILLGNFFQSSSHLFGDIGRDFLHIAVGLQIATRHIERDVGRIDYTLQKHHKIGHHAFHAIGNKHLIAVELNAVFANIEIVFDFREIENTGECEGEIHIEVNPE